VKVLYATAIVGLLSLTAAKGDDFPGFVALMNGYTGAALAIETEGLEAKKACQKFARDNDFTCLQDHDQLRYLLITSLAREILLASLPNNESNKARIVLLKSEADDLVKRSNAYKDMLKQKYP
jgi:hypothetical protein